MTTLQEIEEHWSIHDLLDAIIILDYREREEKRLAKDAENQSRRR